MASSSVLSSSEATYLLSSLLLPSPIRADGRGLHAFRPFSLSTGVAPQANGSARVLLGGGGAAPGGTEVVTAVRLDVNERVPGLGKEEGSAVGGRPDVVCSVDLSPSAFPHLDSKGLDALALYLTTLLQHTLPPTLPLLPITPSLAFHYTIDVLVLSSAAGNLPDALFLSVRSALHDLAVPRTRNVAYEAPEREAAERELGASDMAGIKGAATGGKGRKRDLRTGKKHALGAEFEVEDFWDEGDALEDRVRDDLPVCITLNVLPNSTHFLDASAEEALASPTHLLLFITGRGQLVGTRLVGNTELSLSDLQVLIKAGKEYAAQLIIATNAKLRDPATAQAGGAMGGLGFFGS